MTSTISATLDAIGPYPTAEQVWDAWVLASSTGREDVAVCLLGAACCYRRRARVNGAMKRRRRWWLRRARTCAGGALARRNPFTTRWIVWDETIASAVTFSGILCDHESMLLADAITRRVEGP